MLIDTPSGVPPTGPTAMIWGKRLSLPDELPKGLVEVRKFWALEKSEVN